MSKIKIAISSCLAGNAVRYDAKHKRSVWLEKLLEQGFELVTICPEVEIGLLVPRPPIELVQEESIIKVKMVADHSQDFTDQLKGLFRERFELLSECSGYICAEKSPSCGYKTTPIFDKRKNKVNDNGSGIFVAEVAKTFPNMPIINHRDLAIEKDLANFLKKVKLAHQAIS